jgi:hypothetical protein
MANGETVVALIICMKGLRIHNGNGATWPDKGEGLYTGLKCNLYEILLSKTQLQLTLKSSPDPALNLYDGGQHVPRGDI